MKSGSYHRIGKYDLWYGYQGADKNHLRIEWVGEGVKIFKAKLIAGSIIKVDEDNHLKVFAKTKNGSISITRTDTGFLTIQIKWWFILIFWGRGKESGYKGEGLIAKICSINKI